MVIKRIAVIPARGGSKRIPQKNIFPLNGRPMIEWTIEAALTSGLFEHVVVSTDCPAIAQISKDAGAQVPFLRDTAADDQSPVSAATLVAIQQAESYWNTKYDVICQLMPNCPIRNCGDIQNAISQFENNGRTFQISAFRFGWMNPWWAMMRGDYGDPSYLFPEAKTQRSQDLPELWCPSGAVWVAKRDAFVEAGTFYGPGHLLEPITWQSAMDIDDMDDLAMAEALMFMQSKTAEKPTQNKNRASAI